MSNGRSRSCKVIKLLLSAGIWVVGKSQGDKSASQSSMELYYPWISGPLCVSWNTSRTRCYTSSCTPLLMLCVFLEARHTRSLIGGTAPKMLGKASISGSIMTMDAEKQKLFLEVMAFEARRPFRGGRQKSMTVEEWNSFADYACWGGPRFGTCSGAPEHRWEGAVFEGPAGGRGVHQQVPGGSSLSGMFPGIGVTSDDLKALHVAQRELQFKLDLVNLTSDMAKLLPWLKQRKVIPSTQRSMQW